MPLGLMVGIVIHSNGRTEGCPVICAAHEHHLGRALRRRHHTGQHVNVVISRAARVINRQETLSGQSRWIDSPAAEVAAHVNRSHLIKSWGLTSELRIARASAVKLEPFTADEKIAVAVHIERSKYGFVRNIDRRLPCDSGVNGTIE